MRVFRFAQQYETRYIDIYFRYIHTHVLHMSLQLSMRSEIHPTSRTWIGIH